MSRYYSYGTIRANAYDVTLANGAKYRCIDPDVLLDIEPADVRKNIKAKKVIGGGEHNGATCWFECSSCHGSVDIEDAYCKHCGAVLEYEPTADVVEVVRCKDCRKWITVLDREKASYGLCEGQPQGLATRNKNDFCSYGERADNG